jgi:hypothetical protein
MKPITDMPMALAHGCIRIGNVLRFKGWDVEHLASFNHYCVGQGAMAGVAMARGSMDFNQIGFGNSFERVARVSLLTACGILARQALRLWFGFGFRFVESVRGQWFAFVELRLLIARRPSSSTTLVFSA